MAQTLRAHDGSLSQSVTLGDGPATLTFWYQNWSVTAPFDATLTVKIDSTVLQTYTEAATAETSYTQKTIDVTAFASGTHTLSFDYLNGGEGITNMSVDDVSINGRPPATDRHAHGHGGHPARAGELDDSQRDGHGRGRDHREALLQRHLRGRHSRQRHGGCLQQHGDHSHGAGERHDDHLRQGHESRSGRLGLLHHLGPVHRTTRLRRPWSP